MIKNNRMKIIVPAVGIAFICTLILTIFYNFTQEKIADNSRRHKLPVLNALMPIEHDNDLYNDLIEINEPGFFGNDSSISIFRARKNNNPVGLVILPVITKGYNGQI
ncbi:MAG: hypothetical protein GTO02_12615, partial [Candidatus Dadabacteria bacterium]|nr:hypothetical protein [Candidatus Dadabacteria bacterium]